MECGKSLNVPQPEVSHQDSVEPSSPPGSSGNMRDSNGKATVTEDAMDVKKTTNSSEDAARSATIRSTKDKAMLPILDKANDTQAEPRTLIEQGKDKANVHNDGIDKSPDGNAADCVRLTRLRPARRGQGRAAEETFFHTVPKSHGGPDKKRAVFRVWPRRPDGKPIVPTEEPIGTLSPDGFPWGATLYDFYSVNTVPGDQSAMSHMTGSALLHTMKALGEYDAPTPEIEWALSERTPRDEGVAKLDWAIKGVEKDAHQIALGNRPFFDWTGEDESSWSLKKEKEEKHKKEAEAIIVELAMESEGGNSERSHDEDCDEEDEGVSKHDHEGEDGNKIASDDVEVDPASVPHPSGITVMSPFHPSHYPKPWPFVPFEKPVSIRLQERIPSYLLPRTLYVHDPFNLLPARERRFHNTSWNSQPDIVRTYNIKHSKAAHRDPEEERQAAEELEDFKARTLIVLRFARTEEQIKNYEPVIEVPLPPYPRCMTSIEESHLYLSPVAKVGEGHHSVVYKGEWELPRDLFMRPNICLTCFNESTDKEIQRLKDTGRWEKLLRAAGWGPMGFTGRQSTQAELDEVSDPSSLGRDGEIIDREIIFVISPTFAYHTLLETMDECNAWDVIMANRDMKTITFHLAGSSDDDKSAEASQVPIIRINPSFSYTSDQKTCKHSSSTPQVPRTAKFAVIAKLSLENDHHLIREARNYQRFPERFFHHYDGYTLIDQLHAIVPVHAIVPQFYGYYTPQEVESEKSYLSPILLLEHCGDPIVPETLSLEDQEESVSMLLRFHGAGWLHESIAPRNFLVQKGKPTDFPLLRRYRPELSFRLIDFGRSRKFEETMEKRGEELAALHMFQKLDGKMSVTPATSTHPNAGDRSEV